MDQVVELERVDLAGVHLGEAVAIRNAVICAGMPWTCANSGVGPRPASSAIASQPHTAREHERVSAIAKTA
jgi:hypothetical protein